MLRIRNVYVTNTGDHSLGSLPPFLVAGDLGAVGQGEEEGGSLAHLAFHAD